MQIELRLENRRRQTSFWGGFLIVAGLSGCASLADLHEPKEVQHFVLSEDHARVETRGLAKLKVLEGLRAGAYRAVKEDADGVYFEGNGSDCVLVLVNTNAERYLSTGKADSYEKRRRAGANYGGGQGGLWLPKPGVNKEPRIFYSINNSNGSNPPLGITLGAIVSATEGALAFLPYGSEKDFIAKLRIVPGVAPNIQCPLE